MEKHGFSLSQLLHDLVTIEKKITKWQDVEQFVVDCCRIQDPKAIHNIEREPDVLLSNSFGIEAKGTKSTTRSIHLNSAAPDPKTFYAIIHHANQKVKNVALVSGQILFCKEIEEINKINTSNRPLSNPYVTYRTRVMWEITSPFQIWGIGNFVVDKEGKVHRY